ncbi:MAG: hypothetical protein Q8L23_01360 [Caulobacter sp.]|nr:hypothetical protein [Caulobacter sp.]
MFKPQPEKLVEACKGRGVAAIPGLDRAAYRDFAYGDERDPFVAMVVNDRHVLWCGLKSMQGQPGVVASSWDNTPFRPGDRFDPATNSWKRGADSHDGAAR